MSDLIKLIREKDGKVIEFGEIAYRELKKSGLQGFREFKIEAPQVIKQTTLNILEDNTELTSNEISDVKIKRKRTKTQ